VNPVEKAKREWQGKALRRAKAMEAVMRPTVDLPPPPMSHETPPVLVLTAPSGAGKSTVAEGILKSRSDMVYSVSHTTRKPRPGEVEGEDYYFVSEEEFLSLVDSGGFVEWAKVHDCYYGTSKAEIRRLQEAGRGVLLILDVQGAGNFSRVFDDALLVFLVAPSLEELERRLRARGTESEEQILGRLETAIGEMEFMHQCDYTVVNDRVERAVGEILSFL